MIEFQEDHIVVHGHRGCRGYRPENTIAAFLYALDLGANALEMDVVCSADNKLVVSHDPVISCDHFERTDGIKWKVGEELVIHQIQSFELNKFKRKHNPNLSWEPQKDDMVHVPLFSEVVDAVRDYCSRLSKPLPVFNVEIKSNPAWEDNYQPGLPEYTRLIRRELREINLENDCLVQSFDPRILKLLHDSDVTFPLVLLSEKEVTMAVVKERLGFMPWGLGLLHILIQDTTVNDCLKNNLRLLAWTVNERKDFDRLRKLGVVHIITDFPDLSF